MKEDGVWLRESTTFFDVRVTHVNSKCNQGRPITQMVFKENENEKKTKYQQRELDVEMGTFPPPMFSGQMVEWGLIVKCFLSNWQKNWQKRIKNDSMVENQNIL